MAIRTLKAPLRKGSCHGSAVTEGSTLRTSCNAPHIASGGALSVTSDRKCPKNAAKIHGFGFLARAWCSLRRNSSAPRIEQRISALCFRIAPAFISVQKRLRAGTESISALVPRGRPPRPSAAPLVLCHCEGTKCPWQSVPPSLKVPLRKGKSPKRCQWQMQRGDFEEVPRLAAMIGAGNRLARRWAGWREAPEGSPTTAPPCPAPFPKVLPHLSPFLLIPPCILPHLCYTTTRQVSTPCPSAARGVRSAPAVL